MVGIETLSEPSNQDTGVFSKPSAFFLVRLSTSEEWRFLPETAWNINPSASVYAYF